MAYSESVRDRVQEDIQDSSFYQKPDPLDYIHYFRRELETAEEPIKFTAEEKHDLIEALKYVEQRLEKDYGLTQYQYHGRAKDMPKRLREHFESKGIKWPEFTANHPDYPALKAAWDSVKGEKGALHFPSAKELSDSSGEHFKTIVSRVKFNPPTGISHRSLAISGAPIDRHSSPLTVNFYFIPRLKRIF